MFFSISKGRITPSENPHTCPLCNKQFDLKFNRDNGDKLILASRKEMFVEINHPHDCRLGSQDDVKFLVKLIDLD